MGLSYEQKKIQHTFSYFRSYKGTHFTTLDVSLAQTIQLRRKLYEKPKYRFWRPIHRLKKYHFFIFLCKILMRFTEYIYLLSFNSLVHIKFPKKVPVTHRRTDRDDESIRVQSGFSICLQSLKMRILRPENCYVYWSSELLPHFLST